MDEATKIIVKDVAERAAKRAVETTLMSLGVDYTNPLETQRDMAALREWREIIADEEFKKDLMHLRRWRKAMDGVQNKGILTVVGIAVTGLFAAAWLGFQAMIGK